MSKNEPGAIKEGFIPLSVPYITGNEWKYLKECLDTNWVSSAGPFVEKFEEKIAKYTGSKFAVSTINGTSALHIALKLSGIKEGEEVIVSDLTFVAPANAVRYLGAYPIFIDADEEYGQMDVEKLEEFLKKDCVLKKDGLYNKHTKRKIKAILPVHILGGICEMEAIIDLASKYDLKIVEDATEALGTKYKNKMAGTFGNIGVLSFNGNKIITTGAGGMIITDDKEIAGKARYLTTQAKDDPIEYIHNEIGYNYRMPNLLAAFGVAQLEKINEFIEKKRKIAKSYNEAFKEFNYIKTPKEAPNTYNTFWLYTIRIEKNNKIDRFYLMKELEKKKIQTRPLWQPMHLLKIFKSCFSVDCKNAEEWKEKAISLPCSVALKDKEQAFVIKNTMELF